MDASLLLAFQVFSSIPLPDQAIFLAAWEERTVGEGEVLSEAGTCCRELFFIQRGVLCLVDTSHRKKPVTHSFRREGQFCTILASFEQQVATPLRIQAACPAQVLAIQKVALAELEQRLPYLPRLLTRLAQQTLLEKLLLQRD